VQNGHPPTFTPDTDEGSAVQDRPTPSEEEHERDEDAMRYAGHDDPDAVADEDE